MSGTLGRVARVLRRTIPLVIMVLAAGCQASRGLTWDEAQAVKRGYLESAARHAMEQQKTTAAEAIPLAFARAIATAGDVEAMPVASGNAIMVEATVSPHAGRNMGGDETFTLTLREPVDMIARHSGLAFIVEADPTTSPEVRIGCRLTNSAGKTAVIDTMVPVRSAWGDDRHEIYLDWSFIAFGSGQEAEAIEVLQNVRTIEFMLAGRLRAPRAGPSTASHAALFILRDLRLVDYLKGSYDPSRQWLAFDEKTQHWKPGEGRDLTLQHRVQEITGVVTRWGGSRGLRSAVDSLDFCARTLCWDGSLLDGRRGARTVTSGEYTYGFTTYGMLCGYQALEEAKAAQLDETIRIGAATMTRREHYKRMFHRLAMSRTAALPAEYRDDIIASDKLITGANRVLGYVIAMRMVAEMLPDKARREEVLAHYRPAMQQIVDAQGRHSGGFPILGEGDKYDGKGIHYDAGYTRTHMDWLVVGVRRTGDPMLVEMLRRYQPALAAVMNAEGTGLMRLLSERGSRSDNVELIMPDATAQVGMKHQLPIIAQWGYNVGMPVWQNWGPDSGNHFTFAGHARGYGLGTFIGRLAEDMQPAPEPRDLGYLFPRQYPIWSSRLYNKDGRLQRTSKMIIHPDGRAENDFRIEVGEYLETVGVPVRVTSSKGMVTAVAESLSGWPRLLPEEAAIEISGDVSAGGKLGQAFEFTLKGPTRVVITGPTVTLPPEAGGKAVPFRAELTLTPEHPGQTIQLTVLRGNSP